MAITVLKVVIWRGKSSVNHMVANSFTPPQTRRRKTKIPTIKPTIHLPK